ncbi:NAD(P)/FAD-dependent oxidoreductase [Pontibacillus sp. HMF3514]|uniref:phytoene desaturase family protein n=1 Tax=Pontibacillus sp. HMF3514 TaxID=2692425 RepID=UPI00131F8159|nr:phytoene desaturase family protein [Pontibacillus sp. HMF3514]QHE51971.1 phytoene desaturase [Pontibacillus sp. HMF3514]
MKTIAIVGAGPGGLASAMMLAAQGNDVHVFEKQHVFGGRNAKLKLGDYEFDVGPTFFSMPHILEEIFEASGRKLEDYVSLRELDPMYHLKFEDQNLTMYRDPSKMKKELSEHFPGSEQGYERFMAETRKRMAALMPMLQNRHHRLIDYVRPRTLKALPQLALGKSLYDVLSQYFSDERLKLAFTFQAKYLGMSPWECPGAFSILSFMEHEYGVYHPIGGVNQISKAMAEVVEEYGGRIHLNKGVNELILNGSSVEGVELQDGSRFYADEVIMNADFAQAMSTLVKPQTLKKYSKENLSKRKYSCSTFMMYIGVNKEVDLPHHTIIFSQDYKQNVEEITKTKELSQDPSIYVHNACKTDPTLAPEGKSALYILAPVPNNFSEIDWDQKKLEYRKLILEQLEEKAGLSIEEDIEVEKILTPKGWELDHDVYQGATFNFGHQLSQMMYFRPHNRFEELSNCWIVGGGTHPGSGLPTILESARITSNWLMENKEVKRV